MKHRMRLMSLLVWLVFGPFAAGQTAPRTHLRFFNDSAKAVKFYVDGQFRCSIPANPEGNLAYCDAEAPIGKHKITAEGANLPIQSCDLYAGPPGAQAHLPKRGHLTCTSILNK